MNNPAAPATDPERDQQLADLLTLLTERRQRGEATGLETMVRDHPDLADELRKLWAAVQVAGAFGKSAPRSPHCRAASVTTSCWKRSAAAAWDSFTGRGRSASTASSP